MTVVRVGGGKPDGGGIRIGRILRIVPLMAALTVSGLECSHNVVTRGLEYVAGERREADAGLYRGSDKVDPNRKIELYDNGVVFFTPEGWAVAYIDQGLNGEMDGRPDIYSVVRRDPNYNIFWYRGSDLFEKLVRRSTPRRGVFLFPSSQFDVLDENRREDGEILRRMDADYQWLVNNGTDIAYINFVGERPDRVLKPPNIYTMLFIDLPPP